MTWSIDLKGQSPGDVYAALLVTDAPQPIKSYVISGIAGLAAIHGDDVLVDVQAHGHLCTGKVFEETTAQIGVRKSQVEQKETDEASDAERAAAEKEEADRAELEKADVAAKQKAIDDDKADADAKTKADADAAADAKADLADV